MRLLHLSDVHLLSTGDRRLRGVPTRDTLEEVLADAASRHGDAGWLVLTGDLAHDERAETYAVLREVLGPWCERLLLVPGNHDDRPALKAAFPERLVPDRSTCNFAAAAGAWRLVGLDSQVPGKVHGALGDEQLSWLDGELGRHPEAPTALFVHHPPFRVGSYWVDRIGLRDARALAATLAGHAQVKAVFSGHVHQEASARVGPAEAWTSPSTCFQFHRRSLIPRTDDLPPGYRVVELEPGGFRTHVVRMPALRHAFQGPLL